MRRLRSKYLSGIAALSIGAAVHANADVTIQDPTQSFKVSIRSDVGSSGHFHPGDYIQSFQRASDLFSPLANESYGLSLDKEATQTSGRSPSLGGYASNYIGTSNINVLSEDFTANSAKISVDVTEPNSPGKPLLQVDQTYSFAADNVLRILTRITNVNKDDATLSNILFRRNANMNLGSPETVNISGAASEVTKSSKYGSESPSPLDVNQDPTGSKQTGGSFTLGLGALTAGQSESFDVYEAITRVNQSASDLSGEVAGLGGKFRITGSGANGGEVLAFGDATPIPEASTMLGFGALISVGGLLVKRRTKITSKRRY